MADAWIQGPNLFVEAGYDDAERCKAIPGGRWLKDYKVWKYAATPATAHAVTEAFPSLRMSGDVRKLAFHWSNLLHGTPPRLHWPSNVDRKPWSHQQSAYEFMDHALGDVNGSVGLFAGMGTGKTLVTIAVMASRAWKRVLVVCPVNMVQTWADEISDRISARGYIAYPLTGSTKKRAKTLQDALPAPSVFITNYQGVWRGEFGELVQDTAWDAVILDEAQAIKGAGSKVSMFLDRLGRKTPFRIALTGTPLHDKPTDAYGLYRFLDPGIFGTSFARFKDVYTIQRTLPTVAVPIVVGYQNLEDLSRRMYQNAFRVTEDVLDLPESLDTVRYVDLSPKAWREYLSLQDEFVLNLAQGSVVAGNALTKLLRLQQIAAGFVPVQDLDDLSKPPTMVDMDRGKRDGLAEILDELPEREPVVIFAKFVEDLKAIRTVVEASGRTYREESGRSHQWRDFQNGDGDVLGVQIDAGSSGIDLTRACYAIYYTVGYSLGNYEQSRRRLLRPGQTRPVRYVHLLTRNTVDETVMTALQTKQDLTRYVIDALQG